MNDLPSSDQAFLKDLFWYQLLEIILRGGGESVLSSNLTNLPYLIFWIILAYQYHKTMSMNKENRQSHQRTQDVRWKPNVGENHLLQYVSIFFQFRNSFTMILYWCSPLPVRRLQPAESYNSLSFSSLSWKGATTPYFFSWRIKWSTSNRYSPLQISDQ